MSILSSKITPEKFRVEKERVSQRVLDDGASRHSRLLAKMASAREKTGSTLESEESCRAEQDLRGIMLFDHENPFEFIL